MINWWKTKLSEKEESAAVRVIHQGHLSNGPIVKQFEKAFSEKINVKHVVSCPNGTMAIVMALLANGIKPGDEVIVPASTWISTAHAAMLIGAKISLVDVLSSKPIINPEIIENKINSKTKAIIPVHLNGRAADIRAIQSIANKYGLSVIEDSCQAMLSKNNGYFLGTQSNAGCFSLGVTKLITTGQGGLVVTNDDNIYEKLLLIKNNGLKSIISPKYECYGANFKFSDILAAIGLVQLGKIERHAKSVKELYKTYQNNLSNLTSIKLIPVEYKDGELPLYVEVIVEKRKELMNYMKSKRIQTRVLPPCLNHAPQLQQKGNYSNSEFFGNFGMYLPSGPDRNESEINDVLLHLNEFENFIS